MNKSNLKQSIKQHFGILFRLRDAYHAIINNYYAPLQKYKYGSFGKNSMMQIPASISDRGLIYLDDYVRVRNNFCFDGFRGKLIIKKYTAIGRNAVVVTSNHTKTVGVGQFYLGPLRTNDNCKDITIGEDVWVGANCTLLPGCKIGRGCLIGACSMVNKELPPYAVAVGCPAKIIASCFTIDEIIKHEEIIYAPEERISRAELESIFETYYTDKKSIGKDNLTETDILRIKSLY